ncbi:uncharacterized protein LOC110242819 [Exaiptasia diaphana]|uniref:Uncharacterized protein n=1 Tax=Exaiptasia diaphana TaxID=2652724 RepID=A0A913XHP4_EXADI|nr:uncharacterized protein LOC110242819 [Exaiptasia diaphana]
MKLITFLMVGLLGMLVVPNLTDAGSCSSTQTIRRVYVIRRNLSFSIFKWCALAHSGLILEMTDGKQCVLEYMGNSRTYLYDANPTSTTSCWIKRCKKLVMADEDGKEYTWTRQKYGTSTARYPSARITPQKAKQRMKELMQSSTYNLLSHNCHIAQEKLRRDWGMTVPRAYTPNVQSICSCSLPPWLPGQLGKFLRLVKAYCRFRRG